MKYSFISANGHSRDTLKITRLMLTRLFSYCQVMHSFLDFISVFGLQEKPRDIRFSSFREQNLVSRPDPSLASPILGRSERQYQLCYNLKSVGRYEKSWSTRQAAIYHQFDVNGNAVWIITQGHWDIKDRIADMTGVRGRERDRKFGKVFECFRSSLSVHLLLCEWSIENWRFYLQSLEDSIEKEVWAYQFCSPWQVTD